MRQSMMALLNSTGDPRAFSTLLNLDTSDEKTKAFKRALYLVLNQRKGLGLREDGAHVTGTVKIDWKTTNRILSCPEYQRLYQDAFNQAVDSDQPFENAITGMLFCYYYRFTTLAYTAKYTDTGFDDLIKKLINDIYYEIA